MVFWKPGIECTFSRSSTKRQCYEKNVWNDVLEREIAFVRAETGCSAIIFSKIEYTPV
jgi:hypothetical protein